jgi:hypothetical protein
MDFAMRTSGGLLLLAFAVAASAQQPACKVDPFPRARKGETVLVKMHVLNNGTACSISPHVGNGKAQSITILARPKSGLLVIDGDAVRYTPTPGFSGADSFLVEWIGRAPSVREPRASFRSQVEVEVRSKQ